MKLFLLVTSISHKILKDYRKIFRKTYREEINEKQIYDNHDAALDIIQSKQSCTL